MSIVTTLFDRIRSTQQAVQRERVEDVRHLVIESARQKMGLETEDVVLGDNFYETIDREGWTEPDLLANEEIYIQRFQNAKLATQKPALQKAAEAAEAAWKAADLEAGQVIRAAREKLLAAEVAMQQALRRRDDAIAAESNLVATGARCPEDVALDGRQAEVNAAIRELEAKLNPNANKAFGGAAYDVHRTPGAMVAECRREIAKLGSSSAAHQMGDRLAALRNSLSAAENAVKACEKELAKLTAERDKIVARQAKLSAERMKPENFTLVRSRPSADEMRKQNALKAGWHAGSGVQVGV